MNEEKIKVLALLPMELPKEIELDNTLEAMQNFVGGLIECITCQPCICPESRRTQISGTRDFHGRTGDADPEPKEHAHRADGNCSSGLRSAYL